MNCIDIHAESDHEDMSAAGAELRRVRPETWISDPSGTRKAQKLVAPHRGRDHAGIDVSAGGGEPCFCWSDEASSTVEATQAAAPSMALRLDHALLDRHFANADCRADSAPAQCACDNAALSPDRAVGRFAAPHRVDGETRAAVQRLSGNNDESGMFAVLAAQAVRKMQRERSRNVLNDATQLLADVMAAHFRRRLPDRDDLYADLAALALDRIDWSEVARLFTEDALAAEPFGDGVPDAVAAAARQDPVASNALLDEAPRP